MDKKQFIIILASSVLAIFLGSFLASYIIFGRTPKPPHIVFFSRPTPPNEFFEDDETFYQMNKALENQQKFLDKMNKDFESSMNQTFAPVNKVALRPKKALNKVSTGMKTEETKDYYKITMDLRPFNNDENNVKVSVKDNTVSISAKYKSKEKNSFSSADFSQSLTLPVKIEDDDIKKQKQGNFLVITIPKDIEDEGKAKDKDKD